VEEAAAAAESLQQQAQSLTQAVSVFKVAQREDPVAVQAPAPAVRTAIITALTRHKPAPAKPAVTPEPMHQTKKVANARASEAEWQEF
jgi:hypothetical protein